MTALEGAEAGGPVSAGELFRADRKGVSRKTLRPVPDDFTLLAPTMSVRALVGHYATGDSTVNRWIEETGVSRPLPRTEARPIPADFRERAKTMHRTALARHYRAASDTITRWGALAGVAFIKPPLAGRAARRDLPRTFTAIAPTLTRRQLRTQYQASAETVDRWLREAKVSPLPIAPSRLAAPSPSATDGSLYGAAAHYLRRHFPSVHRVDVLPKEQRSCYPNHGKDMWIVGGRGAVNAEQLLALAQSKGFDPNAWARI